MGGIAKKTASLLYFYRNWSSTNKNHYQPLVVQHMNKATLVEKLAEFCGTKADAERAMEMLIAEITRSLKGGTDVSIAGLGIFKVKSRAARTARNPRTGAMVQVPATRVPKFTPAKALKDAVKK